MVIEETPCGLQTREIDVQFDLQYQNNYLRNLHVVYVDRPPLPPPSFNAEKGKNTEKGKGSGRKETWIEDDTTPLIPSHVKQKMVFLFLFSYLDFKKSAPPNQCRCPLDVLTQTTPLTIITGMDIKGFISLHATVTTVPAYNSRRDQ